MHPKIFTFIHVVKSKNSPEGIPLEQDVIFSDFWTKNIGFYAAVFQYKSVNKYTLFRLQNTIQIRWNCYIRFAQKITCPPP